LEGQKAKIDRQKRIVPRGHSSDFSGRRAAGDLIMVPSDNSALDQDIICRSDCKTILWNESSGGLMKINWTAV
jgi:hypothetical protein